MYIIRNIGFFEELSDGDFRVGVKFWPREVDERIRGEEKLRWVLSDYK